MPPLLPPVRPPLLDSSDFLNSFPCWRPLSPVIQRSAQTSRRPCFSRHWRPVEIYGSRRELLWNLRFLCTGTIDIKLDRRLVAARRGLTVQIASRSERRIFSYTLIQKFSTVQWFKQTYKNPHVFNISYIFKECLRIPAVSVSQCLTRTVRCAFSAEEHGQGLCVACSWVTHSAPFGSTASQQHPLWSICNP